MNIIDKTIEYVKKELASIDASHDFYHIQRVKNTALHIGKIEQLNSESIIDLEVVSLAALLHDIKDYKYSGDEKQAEISIKNFLESLNYSVDNTNKIIYIVKNIGCKEELNNSDIKVNILPELAIVQDADRLDAIGAIGIARAFAYAGYKRNSFWNPAEKARNNVSKDEYVEKGSTCVINHFYEKLFLLKDMMKTKTGREIAEQRHNFMERYVDQFFDEVNGNK